MSQAATTWQSSWARNAFVLAGPIMPQPITPIVMRLEADGRAPEIACAHALPGRRAAAPAARTKSRRVMDAREFELDGRSFIVFSDVAFTSVRDSKPEPRHNAGIATSLYIRRNSNACKAYLA